MFVIIERSQRYELPLTFTTGEGTRLHFNMKIINYLFLGLLPWMLSSCYYNNRLVYLQNKHFSESNPTLILNSRTPYLLQPADILSVQVKSSTETESSNTIFNVASRQNAFNVTPGSLFLEGYTIDNAGKINLPIMGEVTIKNLTIEDAQKLIQQNVNKYLTKATVIVKLTSFKITVLGEVKNPGIIYIYNSQVTLLETLGMAGDLTPFANRKNVKLIRQMPTGTQVVFLDLTSGNLLSSKYFYLMPNDVIYVEPFKARANRTNLEILGIIFAGLTTAVLILSYVNQQ
jgi:polysaccharide export outer membrane protein